MIQQIEMISETMATIGPVCMKHDDGRAAVLWYSDQGDKRQFAIFPRSGSGDPLAALRQPDAIVSCYKSIDDVLKNGWRLD